MPEQVRVKIVNTDGTEHVMWTLVGKTIWEVLELSGIDFDGECGGRGTCGKCKVRVKGEVSELGDQEHDHLLPEELKRGERLACYCTVYGAAEVYLDYNWSGISGKATISGGSMDREHKSEVLIREVFIAGKEKDHPLPILDRLEKALPGYRLELTGENLNELSRIDRMGRPTLELYALVFNNEVVKYVGKNREPVYGLALDLGTTSLFAALVDMETGQVVNMSSQSNMQRVYGNDILSRVSYCLENEDGLDKLQRIVINNINSMIEEMVKDKGGKGCNIYKVTVVGNPIMLHFFMGLEVGGFAAAPYTGLFSSKITYPPVRLGLNVNPDAEVVILPQIGGFVGADTIACLLSISPRSNSRYLLIDIGTNGEIVVCNRGKIWATSAAAGPAFEGGEISSGMRAGNGAIDKVWLDKGYLNLHVIGDGLARGICGSAIIDLTASLIAAGCLQETGQLVTIENSPVNIIPAERGNSVTITEASQSASGNPLFFNQDDVRQVQLAKGAIRTGIDVLLKEAALSINELDNIYLAGAFGNYLDPHNAITIGLIPPVDVNKITNIGNAAGKGAILALISSAKMTQAQMLKEKIKYVELANYPGFQDMFMRNMNF
ncbi:MAG: ASKHA domain-containing protein [Syntrophomonas sp.]